MRLPFDGGTPVEIASGAMPVAIAVDATSVYWSDVGSSQLMKAPLAGGPATLVMSESPQIDAITVDAASVYWTTLGAIEKMPLGGGAATALASSGGWWLATDATSVYWANPSGIFKAPK